MHLRAHPDTRARAAAALQSATRQPKSRLIRRLKLALLAAQYNGTRALFARNPAAVAVVWNGLNGSRRVFADGARDAGARVLFFERAPLPGRVTVDPCGVNFANSLPREIGVYTDWLAASDTPSEGWRALRSQIRKTLIQAIRPHPACPTRFCLSLCRWKVTASCGCLAGRTGPCRILSECYVRPRRPCRPAGICG
jgi:hypothetical protein